MRRSHSPVRGEKRVVSSKISTALGSTLHNCSGVDLVAVGQPVLVTRTRKAHEIFTASPHSIQSASALPGLWHRSKQWGSRAPAARVCTATVPKNSSKISTRPEPAVVGLQEASLGRSSHSSDTSESYNSRLRAFYLPESSGASTFSFAVRPLRSFRSSGCSTGSSVI